MIDKADTYRLLNRQLKLVFNDKIAQYGKLTLYSFNSENIKFLKPVFVGFCVI